MRHTVMNNHFIHLDEDTKSIRFAEKNMKELINGEEDHDINQYAETNKQFDTVLEEVI